MSLSAYGHRKQLSTIYKPAQTPCAPSLWRDSGWSSMADSNRQAYDASSPRGSGLTPTFVRLLNVFDSASGIAEVVKVGHTHAIGQAEE